MTPIITQWEKDCIVALDGPLHYLRDCNCLKLAITLWDKEGEQHTEEEMKKWGLMLGEEKSEN